jgi:hypothetical protein
MRLVHHGAHFYRRVILVGVFSLRERKKKKNKTNEGKKKKSRVKPCDRGRGARCTLY